MNTFTCAGCHTINSDDRSTCINCGAAPRVSAGTTDAGPGKQAQTATRTWTSTTTVRWHGPKSPAGRWALLGLLAFVFGGFGGGMYTVFFSGAEMARYELRRGSVVELGPVTVSRSEEIQSRVGPVKLTPEMNPVRIILKARYNPGRRRTSTGYRIAMRGADGAEKWVRNGSISTGKDSSSTNVSQSVYVFGLNNPADFFFEASFDNPEDVTSATLVFRRNTEVVSGFWIVTCVLGAALSLAVLIIDRIKSAVTLTARPTA